MMNFKNHTSSFGSAAKKDFVRNRALYLMVVPVIVYYIMFYYVPMYGTIIAFKDYMPVKGILGSPWVGFQHFKDFFESPYFGVVLGNTLKISLSMLVVGFPAPIILALLINEMKNVRYAKVVQNITYLPHFISIVVICGMVKTFTKDDGIVNTLLAFFGFHKTSLLLHKEYFLPVYVISGVWQNIGWSSIIYLAALSGVDQGLYEAAKIDGASRWKQTLHVTLPSIVPTIVTMLILNVGQVLGVGYEKILLLYNDATASVAEVISTYVYKKGLIDQSWSFSAAVGFFNSVVNLILLVAANKLSKQATEVGLW